MIRESVLERLIERLERDCYEPGDSIKVGLPDTLDGFVPFEVSHLKPSQHQTITAPAPDGDAQRKFLVEFLRGICGTSDPVDTYACDENQR